MLACEHPSQGNIRQDRRHFVFPAAHGVALAPQHRFKAEFRGSHRIVFFLLTGFGIEQASAGKEIGFGRARHQAGHADPVFFSSSQTAKENESMKASSHIYGLMRQLIQGLFMACANNGPLLSVFHLGRRPDVIKSRPEEIFYPSGL